MFSARSLAMGTRRTGASVSGPCRRMVSGLAPGSMAAGLAAARLPGCWKVGSVAGTAILAGSGRCGAGSASDVAAASVRSEALGATLSGSGRRGPAGLNASIACGADAAGASAGCTTSGSGTAAAARHLQSRRRKLRGLRAVGCAVFRLQHVAPARHHSDRICLRLYRIGERCGEQRIERHRVIASWGRRRASRSRSGRRRCSRDDGSGHGRGGKRGLPLRSASGVPRG